MKLYNQLLPNIYINRKFLLKIFEVNIEYYANKHDIKQEHLYKFSHGILMRYNVVLANLRTYNTRCNQIKEF